MKSGMKSGKGGAGYFAHPFGFLDILGLNIAKTTYSSLGSSSNG
jgi:hypothetical protein